MKIKIHRGANQIGGCITEIESSKGDKILIDFGHNLPEGDEKAYDKYDNNSDALREVLQGVSDVYYTHFHGDHIAFEYEIYKAGVTQHIGDLSLTMMKTKKNHMLPADSLREQATKSLEALEHFKIYKPAKTETVGNISITPYFVSHSIADAYMFLIECDGVTILHTGDFREHGYMGGGLQKNLKVNIVPKNVDVLITEGTMLARGGETVPTEWDLQKEATEIFGKYKNSFVLCSSTDADRIVTMYQATRRQKRNRWFVTDTYQRDQIKNIKHSLDGIYSAIKCRDIVRFHDDVLPDMLKDGFTMLVRNTATFKKLIAEIVPQIDLQQTVFVYSQFDGYIDKKHSAFMQSTYDFVHLYNWDIRHLHTSGHASQQTLAAVCNLVNPSLAIIPIHREADTDFSSLPISSDLKSKIVTQSVNLEKSGGCSASIEIKE